MNRQELAYEINELRDFNMAEEGSDYDNAIGDVLLLLGESTKVGVSRRVGNYIKRAKLNKDAKINDWCSMSRADIDKLYGKGLWTELHNMDFNEFAEAWINGYTIKPKWVVSYKSNDCKLYFAGFQFPFNFTPYGLNYSGYSSVTVFDDKDKAEAVALLIDGKVEESEFE